MRWGSTGVRVIASGRAQLVFVHGIGGVREAERERRVWLDALAHGAARAGHSDAAAGLTRERLADVRFADYSDLFVVRGRQGAAAVGAGGPWESGAYGESGAAERSGRSGESASAQEAFLAPFVRELAEELGREAHKRGDARALRIVEDARQQLAGGEETQGIGAPLRVLTGVLTTLLQIPGLRQAAQWASGRPLLGQLAQVGRYLGRGEPDGDGRPLDARVRERVLRGVDPGRPLVVVAHSLGTVVAYEALHGHPGSVRLLVTLGSPLATGAAVLQRVRPRPPRTPEPVERWLNFWDRDDIVVARPRVQRWMLPNQAGVLPVTDRVDSDGVWVHTATKYLRQPAVAGPVVETLRR